MKKKELLIICYGFPPNYGIGGRRWAKFAKELAKNEFSVHVICRKNQGAKISDWTKDTQHANIQIHTLPSLYPTVLLSNPTTLFQKIKYKLWVLAFQFLSKGTFPERSFFWKRQLINKATCIIHENNIQNVLVTVPPFRMGYYASILKLKFPQLNFILDYRDPWTANKTFHGFMNLSAERMVHELKMENVALNLADCVLTTNEEMTIQLQSKLPHKKIITISNGFDSDEIRKSSESPNKSSILKQFIYAGTFYSNLEYILVPFLKMLQMLEQTIPEFDKLFIFNFYGEMDPAMKKIFFDYKLSCVKLYPAESIAEVHKKISEHDYCLLFAASDHAFAFNTKFYEYLANRKPIVIFSTKGAVPDFLTQHKLGIAVNFENFESDFESLIQQIQKNTFDFNSTFNLDQFSTKALSQLLIEQLS